MQYLKYYVLGVENSPLLNEYLDKYYFKLLGDLEKINKYHDLDIDIDKLSNSKNFREFILNPDISSIINYLIISFDLNSSLKLKKEIKSFLEFGISSDDLVLNKGNNINGTNIKLTSFDNNPLNKHEAHPEHIDNGATSGNWGEKTEQEWLDVYNNTFELLKKIDSGFYYELNFIIKKIIPLGTAKSMHNSASYKECIGHIYLGYTIDSSNPEINNLEAIIHESSHNKLNLLMQFDPIILNDRSEKYYSAIRPDARHIHGVFLGYHAFAPTMYMIMKAYRDGYLGDSRYWLEKIALYHIKTKFLQKVIKKYAILTDLGKEVSKEIDYVITLMDKIIIELNPGKEILHKAILEQKKHFNSVNEKYSYLEY